MANESDIIFQTHVAEALCGLPGVVAVMLGGSRAYGNPGPESDWDFALYYRDHFEPQHLRALGWPGEVSEVGGWGGGVFNGGAWLRVDGRKVDVHFRDLTDVEARIEQAERGEFAIEQLMFHLAGIPTYIVVAELALGRMLSGDLPRPAYPEALKKSASEHWLRQAEMTLSYAESAYAPRGMIAEVAGAGARALLEAGHSRLAEKGVWVTNEKTLLAASGLGFTGAYFENLVAEPGCLRALLGRLRKALSSLPC